MEKKVAERLAARAAAGELDALEPKNVESPSKKIEAASKIPPWKAEVEPAPDSGVRASIESPEPERPLTYSVYTVADLEARGTGRATRMSIALAPATPAPARWPDVWKSGLVVLGTFAAFLRAPKPRPKLAELCRVPLQMFLTDLKAATKSVPWRKVGITAGIAAAGLLPLLLVLLAASALTDDIKPVRGASSIEAAAKSESVTANATVESPTPAEPEAAETIELEDETPKPAPKAAKAPPARTAAPKKAGNNKKKVAELFVP